MATASDVELALERLPGAVPAWRAMVDAQTWRRAARSIEEQGGWLVALWASDERDRGEGFCVHAALSTAEGLVCLVLPLASEAEAYPSLADLYPGASRMQRAVYDLFGLRAEGGGDARPWLRHGAWPADVFPLRKDFDLRATFPSRAEAYPFVPVQGEGVHEVPVGPVHAGIIEPGHFRFSVVGEKVLRMEERLGYKHKGIEKLFETMTLEQGARLAARVSGDSTVAYSWAYAMAAEGATGVSPPPRALWLRALLLERERIANHLGDLGALGNDAGLAVGLAQFSRLKEDLLRANAAHFGHRYLMDLVVPGGVAADLDRGRSAQMRGELAQLEREVRRLRGLYDEHTGLQDRFIKAGEIKPPLAARLGLFGFAGRASALAWDLRVELPVVPYDALEVRMATHRNGDVAARVFVRFEELLESLRLCRLVLERLPQGELRVPLPQAPSEAFAVGWIEGWRGEVFIALHAGPGGSIRRLHPHDPSWQNWPVLEHAIAGDIVADFPLVNKSFNLSYSGHDL